MLTLGRQTQRLRLWAAMTAGVHTFHPDLPETCPLPGSAPHQGVLYRAIKSHDIEAWDFLSDAERGREGCDLAICVNWGLSVWITESGVEHARKIVRGFNKKGIARVSVSPEDGVMKATPTNGTNPQPEHHTFWKAQDCDMCSKAEMHIERPARR